MGKGIQLPRDCAVQVSEGGNCNSIYDGNQVTLFPADTNTETLIGATYMFANAISEYKQACVEYERHRYKNGNEIEPLKSVGRELREGAIAVCHQKKSTFGRVILKLLEDAAIEQQASPPVGPGGQSMADGTTWDGVDGELRYLASLMDKIPSRDVIQVLDYARKLDAGVPTDFVDEDCAMCELDGPPQHPHGDGSTGIAPAGIGTVRFFGTGFSFA